MTTDVFVSKRKFSCALYKAGSTAGGLDNSRNRSGFVFIPAQ